MIPSAWENESDEPLDSLLNGVVTAVFEERFCMKTHILFIAAALLAIAGSSNTAFAQSMYGGGMSSMGGGMTHSSTTLRGIISNATGGLVNGFARSYDGGYGGGYGGVATVEGSELSGAAALAQGLGQYNYDTALADKQFEEARRLALDNGLLAQKAYYEARRVNNEHWLAEHRSMPEQLAEIDRSRLPRRLSTSELDPTWGVIRWPAVLEGDAFEKLRSQFDDAFAHRSEERSGVGSAFYRRTQALARDMRAVLDEQQTSMSQMEWIGAMRFIESLGYESRFAPNSTAGSYTLAK